MTADYIAPLHVKALLAIDQDKNEVRFFNDSSSIVFELNKEL